MFAGIISYVTYVFFGSVIFYQSASMLEFLVIAIKIFSRIINVCARGLRDSSVEYALKIHAPYVEIDMAENYSLSFL